MPGVPTPHALSASRRAAKAAALGAAVETDLGARLSKDRLDHTPAELADAEAKMWDLATVLPIVQDNVVAASGPRVDGAALSGPIQVGIFGDAAMWRRIP